MTCLLITTQSAEAASKKRNPAAGSKSTIKKTKVIYQKSASEETRAEHDKRMFRECKGRHNAGACAGYTHK